MPLMQGKSKKAFKHNVEVEMSDGKPKNQSLAIAYSVRRKPKKKMAEGGMINESAKTEHRPMPDERDKDSKMVGRNSGNKPPKNDEWTNDITIKQAQKPSITKLSQPKIVGSDAFSVRNRNMRDEENDLGDSIYPETDKAQPIKRDDELGPNRQGPKVSDMERQHSNKRAPYEQSSESQYAQDEASDNMKKIQSPPGRYAKGGRVEMEPMDHGDEMEERTDESHMMDELSSTEHGEQPARWRDELDANKQNSNPLDMERQHNNSRRPYAKGGMALEMMDHPQPEADEEHHDSIAAAIMAKKERQARLMSDSDEDRMVMMAEGGEIHSHDSIYSDDSDQADLSRNADEDANEEDQLSFNALRKENYSETAGLDQLDSPEDSNEHGHDLPDEDSHDMVSQIRSKMMRQRQFKGR